jgi:polysaccharide export outer membrane protein
MKIKSLLILCFCTLLMASCTSYKSVPYLQNPEAVNNYQETLPMYDAKIMPKDLLTITVNTSDPEASAPYNLVVQTSINASRSTSLTTQPTLQQYLVSNEGTIDFPVLGRLNVLGLTKGQAEDMIREKLAPHFTETPIVTVRMSNYKISVLGEVARPGTFTVSNEKVNIFEALAMAGDLTVWGLRDDVKLIREDAEGQREIIDLNLNKTDIITSPYYYLQQNDILYVTPNKTKAKSSDIGQSTSLWFSGTSIFVSLINILATFLVLK